MCNIADARKMCDVLNKKADVRAVHRLNKQTTGGRLTPHRPGVAFALCNDYCVFACILPQRIVLSGNCSGHDNGM